MSVALDKCVFGQPSVEFLGYKVSSTGIRPLKRKVEAIDKIPPPSTQKELLSFLGALNYLRSSLSGLYINGKYNNAANLLQPLYGAATTLLPTKNRFQEVWNNSPVLQQSFQNAKFLLKKAAEHARQKGPSSLTQFTITIENSHPSKYSTAVI